METTIKELKKPPKLNNPLFIEGLPGVGNVGRISAGYLSDELKAVKFADLFSPHFYPFVLLNQESEIHILKFRIPDSEFQCKFRKLLILEHHYLDHSLILHL